MPGRRRQNTGKKSKGIKPVIKTPHTVEDALDYMQQTAQESLLCTEKEIMQAYFGIRALHNRRVYGTTNTHRCMAGVCRMWEYKPVHPRYVEYPTYVCTNSNTIHICGVKCEYTENTRQTDGHVCMLTGRVVAEEYTNHVLPVSEDDNNNEKKNDHYSRFGGQIRHKKCQRTEMKHASSRLLIHEKLVRLFTHPIRHNILEDEIKRFHQTIHRRINANITHAWTYYELTNLITERYKYHQRFLNPPLNPKDIRLGKLATAINIFWQRIQTNNQRTGHGRTVFVALCIYLLSKGYTQDNITIFPKVPWIAAHAPERSTLNRLYPTLKPRNINVLWKSLKHKIICRKTNTPNHTRIFPPID